MKKVFKKIFVALTLLIFIPCVNAETNSVYYTNANGIEMTQLEYEKLLQTYSENQIKYITEDVFELEMSHELLDVETKKLYSLDTTLYDINGDVIMSNSKEITKEEYEAFDYEQANQQNNNARATVKLETNAKEIRMEFYTYQSSSGVLEGRICIHLGWKYIPKVRSYDVIASRWETTGTVKFVPDYYYGHQETLDSSGDYLVQPYYEGGTNSKSFSNGYGVSMNIFDDSNEYLYMLLNIYGTITGTGTMTAYANYQHATSTTTLAQSKSYNLNANGLGGVIDFTSSSIRAKYDGMGGVGFTLNV